MCIVYAASPCRRAGRNGSQMWGGGQMIEMHINIYPWFKEKQCKISGFILLCFYISDIYALDTIEYWYLYLLDDWFNTRIQKSVVKMLNSYKLVFLPFPCPFPKSGGGGTNFPAKMHSMPKKLVHIYKVNALCKLGKTSWPYSQCTYLVTRKY